MAGVIQNAVVAKDKALKAPTKSNASQSLNVAVNSLLDKEGMRKRLEDLLGKRTPQFVSSIVSLMNSSDELKQCWFESPLTVVQAALKAATFDLPIDPGLGYAYIVPFKNYKKNNIREASFIMGYKGMLQLAMRTGAYETINVVEIREGELKSYNRLTEEITIDFVEDEDVRERLPIIGYVGYFKLVNGTKKTIYMSVKQIDAHEKKHRKGSYQGKGWKDDYEAMCAKTVLRKLIGKWGLMSIDYQRANEQTIALAEAMSKGVLDDEDLSMSEIEITAGTFDYDVDPETGEVTEATHDTADRTS